MKGAGALRPRLSRQLQGYNYGGRFHRFLHRAAEKGSCRKLGFRHISFSETRSDARVPGKLWAAIFGAQLLAYRYSPRHSAYYDSKNPR
jgi:hypothetical protein